MRQMKRYFEKFYQSNRTGLAMLVAAILLMGCWPVSSRAQEKGQKTFSSAEEASDALFLAVQINNEDAILQVLGQDAKQIISSGDPSDDAEHRGNFTRKYLEMHRLVKEPDGTTTLYIGVENWPTPIPLVEKSGKWYFDSEAAKDEILFRRIGHNEMCAIRTSQELVKAEEEYSAQHNNTYARKIVSDPGQQNGLYWPASDKQPESPVGPLVADASVGDGPNPAGASEPFHGYYFRILSQQGSDFAFVAFPAEYRNSGVMTFVVGKDGVVYQKDLGEKTVELAKSIKEYSVDSSWQKAEEPAEQSASATKTK